MKRVLVATALTAGMALLGAQAARADVITQNFTFPTLSGYNTEFGPALNGFNSALGTLTSVDISDSVTATWSGGGGGELNSVGYFFTVGPARLIHGLAGGGNTTVSGNISATLDDSASLAGFTGGSFPTSVSVRNVGGTSATIASTFGTGTLTYNYTPATSVPEPGSLALLGTGLLGLALLRRRRRR